MNDILGEIMLVDNHIGVALDLARSYLSQTPNAVSTI
jgi:hypothetical protein